MTFLAARTIWSLILFYSGNSKPDVILVAIFGRPSVFTGFIGSLTQILRCEINKGQLPFGWTHMLRSCCNMLYCPSLMIDNARSSHVSPPTYWGHWCPLPPLPIRNIAYPSNIRWAKTVRLSALLWLEEWERCHNLQRSRKIMVVFIYKLIDNPFWGDVMAISILALHPLLVSQYW